MVLHASTSQPPEITSGKPELPRIDRDLLWGKQHHISSVTINEKQRANQYMAPIELYGNPVFTPFIYILFSKSY